MEKSEFIDVLYKSLADNKKSLHVMQCYKFPTDYPDHYVMRVFRVNTPSTTRNQVKDPVPERTDIVCFAKSESELHALLPPQIFSWIGRYPEDDPKILGVYM